ncbi:MAG: hypothetical protein HY287_06685 [Planctomycetes bacterium]|nr:hypothetical protein [Planctomycetota bacterium]
MQNQPQGDSRVIDLIRRVADFVQFGEILEGHVTVFVVGSTAGIHDNRI